MAVGPYPAVRTLSFSSHVSLANSLQGCHRALSKILMTCTSCAPLRMQHHKTCRAAQLRQDLGQIVRTQKSFLVTMMGINMIRSA